MTTLYRVVGHSCDSEHPNMRVFQPTVDGSIRGCEHVRISTHLTEREADQVVDLMTRTGLKAHKIDPKETP